MVHLSGVFVCLPKFEPLKIPGKNLKHQTFRTRPDLRLMNLALSNDFVSKATTCTQSPTKAKKKVISPPARTAGNQQHPTPAAPAKTGATRIPGAVNLPSGQHHKPVKSDRFMWIFCTFPEKVLGNSATMARRKTRTEIIALKRMVHHSTAGHHPESGAELMYIRERLGHKSSKMTEIYTPVSMKSLSNTKKSHL